MIKIMMQAQATKKKAVLQRLRFLLVVTTRNTALTTSTGMVYVSCIVVLLLS